MKIIKYIIVVLIVAVFLVVALGQLGMFSGSQPNDIGVVNQRLKKPSLTRNSVSSQADLYPDHVQREYASIEPFSLKNNDVNSSMQHLSATLKMMPNLKIIEAKPDYIYAQAQTKVLKFVDDLEFWVNPVKNVIELRSASRLGKEDFGVNRQRIEAIRAKYIAN